ncbi:MAG: hypothetical protein B6D37_10650, partial [Sphingobacteriales bacterium UTBCD1]
MMQSMKKKLWITLMFLPFLLNAQTIKEDLIKWDAGRKLTWKDYNGNPDPSSDAAAITATYIGLHNSYTDNSFEFRITCGFSKNRSWVRARNDHVLLHEQGHFDITEIFARKLYKALREYIFNVNTVDKDIDKIYDAVLNEKDEMQNLYDHETDFSRNKEKQLEWSSKIEKMLDELKNGIILKNS